MTEMDEFTALKLAVSPEGVATLVLNRPERKNAIDAVLRKELGIAVERIRTDPVIKVLILAGEGNTFCSGGDISLMQQSDYAPETARRRLLDNIGTVTSLLSFEIPVIAAVDGFAYGAGFNLALAADFILATPEAEFCQSFGRLGLIPDAGGMYTLPRIVGLQKAKELVFTARALKAEEALDLGIVYRIVQRDELLATAESMAWQFTNASPVAIGFAKQILNQSLQSDLRSILELEAAAQGACGASSYHKEAVQQFMQRKRAKLSWHL